MGNILKPILGSAEYAQKHNMQFKIFKLKNGANANILWNDKKVDSFIMKDGGYLGGSRSVGSPETLLTRLQSTIEGLKKYM